MGANVVYMYLQCLTNFKYVHTYVYFMDWLVKELLRQLTYIRICMYICEVVHNYYVTGNAHMKQFSYVHVHYI